MSDSDNFIHGSNRSKISIPVKTRHPLHAHSDGLQCGIVLTLSLGVWRPRSPVRKQFLYVTLSEESPRSVRSNVLFSLLASVLSEPLDRDGDGDGGHGSLGFRRRRLSGKGPRGCPVPRPGTSFTGPDPVRTTKLVEMLGPDKCLRVRGSGDGGPRHRTVVVNPIIVRVLSDDRSAQNRGKGGRTGRGTENRSRRPLSLPVPIRLSQGSPVYGGPDPTRGVKETFTFTFESGWCPETDFGRRVGVQRGGRGEKTKRRSPEVQGGVSREELV